MEKPEIEESVKVIELKESLLPNIYIAELEGRRLKVNMDIHREVLTFSKNDKVKLIVSKTKPKYKDGVDFCARGIVANKKTDNDHEKLIISLWGFTVIISSKSKSRDLFDSLNILDEIYYCIVK